jgi:hypothetical protein
LWWGGGGGGLGWGGGGGGIGMGWDATEVGHLLDVYRDEALWQAPEAFDRVGEGAVLDKLEDDVQVVLCLYRVHVLYDIVVIEVVEEVDLAHDLPNVTLWYVPKGDLLDRDHVPRVHVQALVHRPGAALPQNFPQLEVLYPAPLLTVAVRQRALPRGRRGRHLAKSSSLRGGFQRYDISSKPMG